MASLFLKDMKRLGFISSCSSPASTSVVRPPDAGRALDRHTPHLRDPHRRVSVPLSKPPTKPKAKPNAKDSKHGKKASSTTRPEKRPVTLVSPASSSRFLLNSSRLQPDDVHVEAVAPPPFIDIFPDAMPELSVPETAPVQTESSGTSSRVTQDDEAVIKRSCSTRTPDQVVVLRVSLHCKGCAGKVKKHISKMEGVTSFDIDLATKKVTVVGDVTPLGVLNSISKVKSAQFWPLPARPPRASASF